MDQLLQSLLVFLTALVELVGQVLVVVAPWTPLIAWLAFWTFAVNWVKLRDVLVHRGGWIGLLLIGAVMILVWGAVAPPLEGRHTLYTLTLSNYVMKTVYVTALFCLMLLAGSLQLSGFAAEYCQFPEPAVVDPGHGHDDGHGHGHGHAAHGHDAPAAHDPHTGHH